MRVYKRGKYWIVQFNHNEKTYTRSSQSTRKRDALELERQMRQQLLETQVLGHREHIKLHEACDACDALLGGFIGFGLWVVGGIVLGNVAAEWRDSIATIAESTPVAIASAVVSTLLTKSVVRGSPVQTWRFCRPESKLMA